MGLYYYNTDVEVRGQIRKIGLDIGVILRIMAYEIGDFKYICYYRLECIIVN